jgi:hypothetical protein
MGYEITLIVGKSSSVRGPERVDDLSKPFSDGSGYEWKKDENGIPLTTGRQEIFFMTMAEINLCKIGSGHLSVLVDSTHKMGDKDSKNAWYIYGTTDGNKSAKEDKYGDKLYPVPISDVLDALKADHASDNYRRFRWAIALLESMKDDPEKLEVIFWGH